MRAQVWRKVYIDRSQNNT